MYEQLTDAWSTAPLECQPTDFVELTNEHLERKLTAMRLYATQARPSPNARSECALRALAMVRGAQAGFGAAEGFRSLRRRIGCAQNHSASDWERQYD
jgi:LmbE family N-acetylglucosaminyl deacetylase